MKKWLRGIVPLVLSLAAVVVAFVYDNYSFGLGLAAAALLAAFALPSVIGTVTKRSTKRDIDVAKVKAYREKHPDLTIMAAVQTTDRAV